MKTIWILTTFSFAAFTFSGKLTAQEMNLRAGKLHYAALMLYQEGTLAKAESKLQQAFELDPRNETIIVDYVNILIQRKKMNMAFKVLKHMGCDDDCTDEELVRKTAWLGIYGINLGQRSESRRMLMEALRLMADRGIVDNELSSIINSNLGVATIFDQAINKEEGKPEYYGPIHIRDFKRAAHLFSKSLIDNPDNCTAAYNLGIVNEILSIPLENSWNGVIPDSILCRVHQPEYPCLDTVKINPYLEIVQHFIGFDEILFVLDISGSMAAESIVKGEVKPKIQMMQETVLTILEGINKEVALGLLTIDGSCSTAPRYQTQVDTGNVVRIKAQVNNLALSGGTPLNSRLETAPSFFSLDKKKKKAVFLCTDGLDGCGGEASTCEIGRIFKKEDIKLFVFTQLIEQRNNLLEYSIYDCLTKAADGDLLGLTDGQGTVVRKTKYITKDQWCAPLKVKDIANCEVTPYYPSAVIQEDTPPKDLATSN